MNKMKITVSIEDECGNTIVANESEREIPYIEEIEQQGFRAAFHDMETAVLESRKEVSDKSIADYLEAMSKKKPKKD